MEITGVSYSLLFGKKSRQKIVYQLQSDSWAWSHHTIFNPKIKWLQLNGEKRETFKKKLLLEKDMWKLQENTNIMWKNMVKKVEIVVKEFLEESKGFGHRDKET